MPRMIMVMGPMVPRVVMAVVIRTLCMAVGMAMLVSMRVAVHMLMRMTVCFSSVLMGVFMLMRMLVGMVVFVFVVAIHEFLIFFRVVRYFMAMAGSLGKPYARPPPPVSKPWWVRRSDCTAWKVRCAPCWAYLW